MALSPPNLWCTRTVKSDFSREAHLVIGANFKERATRASQMRMIIFVISELFPMSWNKCYIMRTRRKNSEKLHFLAKNGQI